MSEDTIATQQALKGNGEGRKGKEADVKEIELPKTIEELQTILQSEGDKRVTQALKTAQEKWQQKLLQRLEAERKEAERLAKIATEQREKEVLEKYRREIEEKERALMRKELEIKTINLLAERKLPVEFWEFILDKDEEKTLKKLEKFCRVWKARLDEALKGVVSNNLNACAEKITLMPKE